jgi:DNA-directed RNA polymerase specialized sigma24 family protein
MDDFSAWYRKEHQAVFASCFAWTGDRDASAEATDEAFSRALANWKKVSEMTAPGGWVCRVAINVLKRQRLRRGLEARILPSRTRRHTERPSEPAVQLWNLVGGLPLRQWTPVIPRYVCDLGEGDIADYMGLHAAPSPLRSSRPATISETSCRTRMTSKEHHHD